MNIMNTEFIKQHYNDDCICMYVYFFKLQDNNNKSLWRQANEIKVSQKPYICREKGKLLVSIIL